MALTNKKVKMILLTGNKNKNQSQVLRVWKNLFSSYRLYPGFTLIEVMISISILSIGLVFILQGFNRSLNVIKISEDNLEIISLAKEKMAEVILENKETKDSININQELSYQDIDFKLEVNSTNLQDYENLDKLDCKIIWKEGKREGKMNIFTYLRNYSKEE
jgi:prepilin-type N-terminal cleavage/methylation domain-containing protein